jgi:hypothetical protein
LLGRGQILLHNMPYTYTKNSVGTWHIMEWTQFITSVHSARKNVLTTNSMILRSDRVAVLLSVRYRCWPVISWAMLANGPSSELCECVFAHRMLHDLLNCVNVCSPIECFTIFWIVWMSVRPSNASRSSELCECMFAHGMLHDLLNCVNVCSPMECFTIFWIAWMSVCPSMLHEECFYLK